MAIPKGFFAIFSVLILNCPKQVPIDIYLFILNKSVKVLNFGFVSLLVGSEKPNIRSISLNLVLSFQ